MRAVVYSMVAPAVAGLSAIARACGFDPVAVIAPRPAADDRERLGRAVAILTDAAPDTDVVYAASPEALVPLTRAYEPDVGLCTGYSWKLSPEVLAIPRLGVVNGHPSLLPRNRGPYPLAWALRDGDAELSLTYHLMDAEFDTGPILAQGSRPMPADTSPDGLAPTFRELATELLPRALARLVEGDGGDPQPEHGATWAGAFGDDYAELDWSRTAAEVDRQVRAWRWMFSPKVEGPWSTIGGRRVKVLGTRLADPGDGRAVRVDAADGPVWVVEHVPA